MTTVFHQHIEDCLDRNKSAFKTYATWDNAIAAAEKMAHGFAERRGIKRSGGPDYNTIWLPRRERWAILLHITAFERRHPTGGSWSDLKGVVIV
jgi:hypothetical protein